MNKYQTYFGQIVTDDELNEIFGSLSTAIEQFVGDFDYVGIAVGGDLVQNTTPNLSVLANGPAIIYDQLSQRISYGAPTNINCAVDENNQPTSVAGGSNEKWLSVFVKFVTINSDPREDELGNTIFFRKSAGYQFKVVQGSEAPVGTAARPALRGDQILLGDVKLIANQTSILTANISSTRSQVIFDLPGTPTAVRAKSLRAALQAMVNAINAITTDTLVVPAISGSPTSLPQGSVHAVFQAFLTAFNALALEVAAIPDAPDLTGVAKLADTQEFTGTNTFHGFNAKDQLFADISDPARGILATNQVAGSARWYKILNLKSGSTTAGGQYIRAWTGSDGTVSGNGAFAITTNCDWDGSNWSLRDGALPALALIWTYGRLRVSNKSAGSGSWANWDSDLPSGVSTSAKGLHVTEDLVVNGKANIVGNLVCDDLHVEGDATIDGDIDVSGSFTATTLKAASFEYDPAQARTTEINLSAGIPNEFAALNSNAVWEGTGGVGENGEVRVPLRLPVGAIMTAIQIQYNNNFGSTGADLKIRTPHWGVSGPLSSAEPSTTSYSMARYTPIGDVVAEGSITHTDNITEDKTYTLVLSLPPGAQVFAAKVTYSELFPARQSV